MGSRQAVENLPPGAALLPQNKALALQIPQLHALFPGKPVSRRADKGQSVPVEALAVDVAAVGDALDHAEIDLIGENALLDVVGILNSGLHPQLRIKAGQLLHISGQQKRTNSDAGAHPQRSAHVRVAHLLLHLVEQRDNVPGVFQHLVPRLCQKQLLGDTVKQLNAIVFLHFPDCQADRRLGRKQPVRRPGHASGLAHSQKNPQMPQRHIHFLQFILNLLYIL